MLALIVRVRSIEWLLGHSFAVFFSPFGHAVVALPRGFSLFSEHNRVRLIERLVGPGFEGDLA
jgi:hypothetical protein